MSEKTSTSMSGERFKPLVDLLSDPFSEVARERQKALLVCASISLLLSTGLARFSEFGTEAAKFAFISPRSANQVFFAVTLYLLIIYLLAAWADWSVALVRKRSAEDLLKRLEAAMSSDEKERQAAAVTLASKMWDLSTELSDLSDKHFAVTIPLAKEIDDLAEAERYHLPSQERVTMQARLDELNRSFRERSGAISQQIDILHKQNTLHEMVERMQDMGFIRQSKAKVPRVTRARIIIEIVFPAAYGISAIGLAIKNW